MAAGARLRAGKNKSCERYSGLNGNFDGVFDLARAWHFQYRKAKLMAFSFCLVFSFQEF